MEKLISDFQDEHFQKWARQNRRKVWANEIVNDLLMIGMTTIAFLGLLLWISA